MTQGAGQGPEVRTPTVRDFRVPAYVHEAGPYGHSAAPGEGPGPAEDPEGYPEGYTPTQRDLPVINRGDTLQVVIDPEAAAAEPASDRPSPLFVVGDVHGYLDELLAALHEKGLVDAAGNWSAGTARLWFLGDFTDRARTASASSIS